MKKYKLVKPYPGSLEVGTEVTWGNHGLTGECYQAKVKAGIFRFNKDTIENSPEFWQEVEELECEIQSFNYINVIYIKTDKGFTCSEGFSYHSLESHLSDGVSTIHSVKRLSDGLVITVGDTVVTKNILTTEGVTGFRINDGTTSFKKGLWITTKGGGMHLERIKEIQKPHLFVTEDGVKIYKGDSYWFVDPNFDIVDIRAAYGGCGKYPDRKYFSTQAAAQEYVQNNRPRLSIEDCRKIYAAWRTNGIGLMETIEDYVKKTNR